MNFPEVFSMDSIMSKNIDNQTKLIDYSDSYSLYSVVVHSGLTSETGHYYSYCKNEADEWFHCNDTRITKVDKDENECSNRQFYVL